METKIKIVRHGKVEPKLRAVKINGNRGDMQLGQLLHIRLHKLARHKNTVIGIAADRRRDADPFLLRGVDDIQREFKPGALHFFVEIIIDRRINAGIIQKKALWHNKGKFPRHLGQIVAQLFIAHFLRFAHNLVAQFIADPRAAVERLGYRNLGNAELVRDGLHCQFFLGHASFLLFHPPSPSASARRETARCETFVYP